MSMSVRTAKMNVFANSNLSADGKKRYNSADVQEPVNYNVSFSPEAGNDPKHLEQLWIKANNDAQELEIEFSQKKTRFGQELVIYNLKPVTKVSKQNG